MEPPLLFMHILFEAILNTNLPRSKEVLRDTLLHINNLECSFNGVFFFFFNFSQHSDSLITPVTFEKMSPHWLRSIPQTRRYPRRRGNVRSQLQRFTSRSKHPAAVHHCLRSDANIPNLRILCVLSIPRFEHDRSVPGEIPRR